MNIRFLLKILYILLKYLFSDRKRYLNLFYEIFKVKPKTILEIGVYRGTRSSEMIKAAMIFKKNIKFYGFDLFEDFYFQNKILRKELSKKPLTKSDIKKKLKKICHVKLFKGFTNKTLKEFSKKKIKVDFIFIDGGHSLETIKNDWKYSKLLMHKKTIVIFDDYYCNNKNLSKKFGCNFLYDKLKNSDEYLAKLLPFTDTFVENNSTKKIKMIKLTNR